MSQKCEECGKWDCFCDDCRDEWISVKDRLPETDVMLLFISDGRIRFGEYIWYDPDYRWSDIVANLYREDVTHWAHLPKLPKNEEL
jgi:hypothetical protein